MTMKIMRRLVLTLIIVGAGFQLWSIGGSPAHAQSKKCSSIPKAWGSLRGGWGMGLIFEDEKGTIRIWLPNISGSGTLSDCSMLEIPRQ